MTSGTGEALAELLFESLQKIGVTHNARRRFVGLCTDGQYLALHVLRHIAEQHYLELWDGMYAFLYLVYIMSIQTSLQWMT